MEMEAYVRTLLDQAHTHALFLESEIIPTAEAVARLGNEDRLKVWAVAEALQYHLGPGPEYRYRALVHTLADFEADDRPAPLLDRVRQVMAEVERAASLP